jgi:hypothetical protein
MEDKNQIADLLERVNELSITIGTMITQVEALQNENAALAEQVAILGMRTSNPLCPDSGGMLRQHMAYDDCLTMPQPLDSSVAWTRRQPLDESRPGYVRSVLSLLAEGQGVNSYPWPLYVQVRATPRADATMSSANAFGVNARLHNSGGGFGACFFADLQHSGGGTDVAYDLELINLGGKGRTIGLNILNAGDPNDISASSHSGSEAINVQTQIPGKGWNTGIRLEPNSKGGIAGDRGIWVEGNYNVGLDMESNDIKLNRGAKIFLDENKTLYLWLNPDNTRLEFRYLDKVLGFLTLGSVEHEL